MILNEKTLAEDVFDGKSWVSQESTGIDPKRDGKTFSLEVVHAVCTEKLFILEFPDCTITRLILI